MVCNGVGVPAPVMAQGAEQAAKSATHGDPILCQAGGSFHNISCLPQHVEVALDIALGQVVQAGWHKKSQRARTQHLDRHRGLRPQVMLHAVPERQAQGYL